MKSAINSLLVALIAFSLVLCALGFALGYWAASERYRMPDCPSEDSCYADYYDGQWHIVEQQVR